MHKDSTNYFKVRTLKDIPVDWEKFLVLVDYTVILFTIAKIMRIKDDRDDARESVGRCATRVAWRVRHR